MSIETDSGAAVGCMELVSRLRELWTARRTRLLHNEKVYAAEGEYARAIQAAAEAKATLTAMEDIERILAC